MSNDDEEELPYHPWVRHRLRGGESQVFEWNGEEGDNPMLRDGMKFVLYHDGYTGPINTVPQFATLEEAIEADRKLWLPRDLARGYAGVE